MDTHQSTGIDLSWLPRRRLTVDDYHRMGEAGIFRSGERVELIEGELIQMAPIGSEHSGTVNGLNFKLFEALGRRAVVAVQNPVRLDRYSEPEPDFAVLKPREDFYRAFTPRPEDVLLLIEIAQSSLRYDRDVKRRLYARRGIPEFWIFDVEAKRVSVWRQPVEDDYAERVTIDRDGVLTLAALPGLAIRVAELVD